MASIVLTVNHPQLSRTVTVNVPDARLVEFVDNLRTYVYPQPAVTRGEAVDLFLANIETNIRRLYKGAKESADRAALTPPGEIDA